MWRTTTQTTKTPELLPPATNSDEDEGIHQHAVYEALRAAHGELAAAEHVMWHIFYYEVSVFLLMTTAVLSTRPYNSGSL